MTNGSTRDILRKITPRTLLPFILVGIAVIITSIGFKIFGFSLISIGLILFIPVGILIVVNYHRMLPILIMAILVPIRVPIIGYLRMSLTEIVIPALFAVYVLQRMIRKSEYNRVRLFDIPLTLYMLFVIGFIWFIISGDILPQNIIAFEEMGSFRSYFSFFMGIIGYFLLLSLIKEERHIKQCPKIFFWISLLSLTYLFMLLVLGKVNSPLLPGKNWSIVYSGGFSIRSIQMSVMSLILFLVALTGEYPRHLKFRIPIIIFSAISIIIAGGRGTFTGWLLAILVYVFLKKRYMILTGTVLVTAIAVAVPLLYPHVVKALPEPAQRVFSLKVGEDTNPARSWETRFVIWERSLEDIKKRPLTGVGFRGFDINLAIYGQLVGEELFVETAAVSGSTHNGYIAYAQIFGIPGLLLFLLIYFFHFKHSFKMYLKHPDQHVKKTSLFLLLILVAYAIIQGGGGGPKDAILFMYLGLVHAVWLLVLKNQKIDRKVKQKQIVVQKPQYPTTLKGL